MSCISLVTLQLCVPSLAWSRPALSALCPLPSATAGEMTINSFHHDGLRSHGSDDLSIRASTLITSRAWGPRPSICPSLTLDFSVCANPLGRRLFY